jgi:glycosyltransferase involved in cell wall biosynthesis
MRLLCLYPEEWTGTLAREVHILATCVALAESGVDVTLVIAGGEPSLREHLIEVADTSDVAPLQLVELPRTLGPITSTSIFARNFSHWLRNRRPFDLGYILHLKAGPILTQAGIPYAYEAHRIFTQGQQNPNRQSTLHKLEGQVLAAAAFHVATSAPLALALNTWFGLSKDFAIVPSAGWPPLDHSISAPFGPFVYCGSIADPNEFAGIIQAANETRLPLKIVGGNEEEWNVISDRFDTTEIAWEPRVPMSELPEVLSGARAGLIPTDTDSPSGEFACPMKLFDYARCGLPVISTALPAFQSLDVGSWCTQIWCTQVSGPARFAWTDALRSFRYDAEQADAARAWSGEHTWAQRAEKLKSVLGL